MSCTKVVAASSNSGGPENCQTNIFSLEGSVSNINVYCLSTVGTTNMITQNGKSLASYSDNVDVFPDTIALFTTDVVPPTSSSLLGWNYRGGYTDAWARSLGNLVEVLGGAAANTIEACLAACQAADIHWQALSIASNAVSCPHSSRLSYKSIILIHSYRLR
jgi:glucan 1,3-beta-glucosidase